MSHLTEEQFEDILRNTADVPEHVDRCPLCRARLDEKLATAQRIRKAFSSIETPSGLADRIRIAATSASEPTTAAPGRVRIITLYVQRHLRPALAAVAAVLVLAVAVGLYVDTNSPANAAQTALAEIHHTNVDSMGQLVNSEDPNVLGNYLKTQVGHSPAMGCMGSGMNMCGCCVRQFQGRPVASYVIKRNNTPISVIAVPESPEALGMAPTTRPAGATRDIWQARNKCCNMAAVRIGDYSYCAVGEVTQEELAVVLTSL